MKRLLPLFFATSLILLQISCSSVPDAPLPPQQSVPITWQTPPPPVHSPAAQASASARASVRTPQPGASVSVPPPAPTGPPAPLLPASGGRFANPAITESSGLARSGYRTDVLWTVNDSGDDPILYAIGRDGSDLGRWQVSGTNARDWESLCSFRINGVPHLLIGDTGDNLNSWSECRLIAVPEPKINPGQTPLGSQSVRPIWTIRYSYEGGSRDCEAMAVDPGTSTAFFVEKRKEGAVGVFSLPLRPSSSRLTARRIGALGNTSEAAGGSLTGLLKGAMLGDRITGMDFSPSGRRAALMSYGRVFLFDRQGRESWGTTLGRVPRAVAYEGLFQPEAVAYASDGKLYGSSEGEGGPLSRIRSGE